jgi:hypothetical protein
MRELKNHKPLMLALGRGLGVESRVLLKNVEYSAGKEIVHFPALNDYMGKCYFGSLPTRDIDSILLKEFSTAASARRSNAVRSFLKWEQLIPPRQEGAYLALYLYSMEGSYIMYRGTGIEQRCGIFLSFGRFEPSFIIESFEGWMSVMMGTHETERERLL